MRVVLVHLRISYTVPQPAVVSPQVPDVPALLQSGLQISGSCRLTSRFIAWPRHVSVTIVPIRALSSLMLRMLSSRAPW